MPESDILAPVTVQPPQPVEMINQEITAMAQDKLIDDELDRNLQEVDQKALDDEMESAGETQPSSDLMSSMISIDAKTPRQIYFE